MIRKQQSLYMKPLCQNSLRPDGEGGAFKLSHNIGTNSKCSYTARWSRELTGSPCNLILCEKEWIKREVLARLVLVPAGWPKPKFLPKGGFGYKWIGRGIVA